jgi:hypothetical protein
VIESRHWFVYIGMTTQASNTKLQELRARTDRQLIAWIDRRIARGLQSCGCSAERIYLEVAPLLVVAHAGPADRARLESQLEQLAESFDADCVSA